MLPDWRHSVDGLGVFGAGRVRFREANDDWRLPLLQNRSLDVDTKLTGQLRVLVDSPDLNRSFPTMEGSGFSAPFVTGMAALLLQKDPDMTPQELFAELWAQSNELGYLSTDK